MKLSVVIVNYNVKYFLEQCLCSVQRAIAGIQAEIIVVDNCSTDNSIEYLILKFPSVKFIPNNENSGFAKACNQGLSFATGDYILFLNPDTIVPEDCFQKCISFFESHPDAGALGIKMIDGAGRFLKESKRAFPSPMTSLYKLFGLSALFPRSKIFSKYHLGYLDENESHRADVLAGAFIMTKKEVLQKTGAFDEAFFMYGEDIDLSYRIQKTTCPATGGMYKNYYFAGSSIIHFKGESTRKGSMNYVRMFYKAMSIFVRKHYGGGRAGVFNFLIQVAIWLRAIMAAFANFIRRTGLPLIDAGLILLSFWTMKTVWNEYFRTDIQYENKLLWIAFSAYTVFYLLAAYYAGLYDRWYKRLGVGRSTLIAVIALLAAYALLPEQYRFSRAIVLFGSLLAFLLISSFRWVLIQTQVISSSKEKEEFFTSIIAGSVQEYNEVIHLLKEAGVQQGVLGRMAVQENDTTAIGNLKKIKELYSYLPFREIIFCQGVLSFGNIIQAMQELPAGIAVKIHAEKSSSMVGSYSKDSTGEVVSRENGYRLSNPDNQRLKRLIDISISFLALLTFPVHLFLVKKPFSFLTACLSILFAKKTWVGYALNEKNLPALRPGVIACNGVPASAKQVLPTDSLHTIDYRYAREYRPVNDLKLIWKFYKRPGR